MWGLAAGCGGSVKVEEGTGGQGTTSGAGNTGNTGNTGNVGNTGGQGAAGGSGAQGGVGGGPSVCDALGHVACLEAFPACVPVYDDACCPSCDPGPCADCVDWQFHHCVPLDVGCATGVTCGFTPEWACAGGEASCFGPPDHCSVDPGCTVATCSLEMGPCFTDECHPVTGDICGPALCNTIPPTCPPGTVPEHADDCYTGYCILPDVCL